MSFQQSSIPLIKRAYSITLQSLKSNPALFIPFLIFAILESIALIVIYLFPRQPLISIFAPPIRTFWGERFLHYPANFLLLPKLASLSRMGLSILFGSLLTGMAIAIILDIYNNKFIKLQNSLKAAFKKYFTLFTIVLIITLSFYFLLKILTIMVTKYFLAGHAKLLFLSGKLWLGPILLCINFIMAIFIQSALVYAIPIAMIENERLIRSIIKSILLFRRLFICTFILVGIPMLLYIPILVLNYNISFLIFKLFPESVLLVSFLSIIVISLVVDPVVSISTTYLYLINKKS